MVPCPGSCGTGQLQAGRDRENRATPPPPYPPTTSSQGKKSADRSERSQHVELDFTKDNGPRSAALVLVPQPGPIGNVEEGEDGLDAARRV